MTSLHDALIMNVSGMGQIALPGLS